MAPRGQPAARAVDLETIENVMVRVRDGPSSEFELRVEQSDNDGDLVVRNDSGDAIGREIDEVTVSKAVLRCEQIETEAKQERAADLVTSGVDVMNPAL